MRHPVVPVVTLAALIWCHGCATQAPIPPPTEGMSAAERAERCEDYRLDYDDLYDPVWKRSDGAYHYGELQDVFDAYPETHKMTRDLTVRSWAIGLTALAGVGLGAYTFGYNIAADEADRHPAETQYALYGVGGGLVFSAVLMEVFWHEPWRELAPTYNERLCDAAR